MYTTYHLSSAQEISLDIIEAIKTAFKEKPISITIEEEFQIPQWQKDEVLNRLEKYKENPTQTLDFDSMMDEIEKELANEG